MSETVFVLGAGASVQAGAPVMNTFLDVAYNLMKLGQNQEITNDSTLVFKGLNALQRVHSKAQLDLLNLEAVFATFEMARLLKRLPDFKDEEIEKLPSAMRRLICHTLESSIQFPLEKSETREMISRYVGSPKPYRQFAELIKKHYPAGNKVSVLTFNYDVCLDHALSSSGLTPEYRLGYMKPELSSNTVDLLKLHGSLNWVRCQHCKDVVAWLIPDFIAFMSNRRWYAHHEGFVRIKISPHLHYFSHCGKPAGATEPVVVPPTWNKTQHHEQLARVWYHAASELADAENIFICGYSLPDTDKFFHYLYALGSVGEARLKRFWVFNPDKDVEARFRSILGQTALQRFKFEPLTFEESLGRIANALRPQS